MTPDELRSERERLRMSQEVLGEKIGIPANTLARWERGEVLIRHGKLLRLALSALRPAKGK